MSVARLDEFGSAVSVADYLAGEKVAEYKSEYICGQVYAMSGASQAHNTIAANLIAQLVPQLRGSKCQPFGSDMKVKVDTFEGACFYYPDASVKCDETDDNPYFLERPSLLFEVLSDSTRRLDLHEKAIAYRTLPTLQAYVIIEQDRAEVLMHRRVGAGWAVATITGLTNKIECADPAVSIKLADLYMGTAVEAKG